MAIERTGRFTWKATGVHAQRLAPFFGAAFLGRAALACMVVYFTVAGVAGLTALPFLVVLIAWLVLCGSLTVNGRRLAVAPEWLSSLLNLASLAAALYFYVAAQDWPAYLLGAFLVLAVVSLLKKMYRVLVPAA